MAVTNKQQNFTWSLCIYLSIYSGIYICMLLHIYIYIYIYIEGVYAKRKRRRAGQTGGRQLQNHHWRRFQTPQLIQVRDHRLCCCSNFCCCCCLLLLIRVVILTKWPFLVDVKEIIISLVDFTFSVNLDIVL